jgi:sugar O-acyltransferase (sialic acid O-acetyltransferase NeuD family)
MSVARQRLIILGTGGSAYDVLDVVEAVNADAPHWEVVGFLDDSRPPGAKHLGFPVLGPLQSAPDYQNCWFVNSIGSDRSYRQRQHIVASTRLAPDRFATLVHPGACVSSRAHLGLGVYVNYGVSVAGDVVVGHHVSLCPGCIVGHNAVLEDYALVAPGAVLSGFVRVGSGCYIGSRAVVRQHPRIGEGALVGMGAVVVRDVAPGVAVVGNPARPLPKMSPGHGRQRDDIASATAQLVQEGSST